MTVHKTAQTFELLNYCRNLCDDIDYVRLDFYLTEDNSIYFGEYTFTQMHFINYTHQMIYII